MPNSDLDPAPGNFTPNILLYSPFQSCLIMVKFLQSPVQPRGHRVRDRDRDRPLNDLAVGHTDLA